MFSALTFVLALLGAISGMLFIKDKWKAHVADRSFRQLFATGGAPIVVVCPTQSGVSADPNRASTFEDAMAQTYIVGALASRGSFAESQLHDNIDDRMRKSDLFLICGPAGNSITKAVFEQVNVPFVFVQVEGGWQIHEVGGGSIFTRQETVDYAIVAAIRNPWNSSSRVWIAAGISGLGTMGAAYLLTHKSGQLEAALKAENLKLSDSFAAVAPVVQVPTGPKPGIIAVRSAA
ncbi:MAG: hypothetical protein K8F53_03765 [Rhodocyclaceae bacterium]|nr:hypothetical protein [Rhodocyclaceae bacterium]